MFTNERGQPLLYRRWKSVWASAHKIRVARELQTATEANRKPNAPDPIDTHDLRHFTASALIAGGASVKQVQMVLGHSSTVITLRIYAHLWPGDDDRARSVMDAVLDAVRTGKPDETATKIKQVADSVRT